MEPETTPLLEPTTRREKNKKAAESEAALPSAEAITAADTVMPRDWVKKSVEPAPEKPAEPPAHETASRDWTRTLMISLLFFLVGAEGALIGVLLVSTQSERARVDALSKRLEAVEVRAVPAPPAGK